MMTKEAEIHEEICRMVTSVLSMSFSFMLVVVAGCGKKKISRYFGAFWNDFCAYFIELEREFQIFN
jgi:hypothetical protein